ncbi:MAG: alpha/beta hydrolase fold domain-containing protein [Solirubrobacterales bacterium]
MTTAGEVQIAGVTARVVGDPAADGALLWVGDAEEESDSADVDPVPALALGSGWQVIAIDPAALQSRFPAPLTAAYRCAVEVATGAVEGLATPAALALGGERFGAGVAAGAALLARRYGGPTVAAQVLLAPVLDARLASPSWQQRDDDPERLRLEGLFARYAPGLDRADPLLSPLCEADLAGLPATVLATFAADSSRDDGERYAGRLQDAGVAVLGHRYAAGSRHTDAWRRAARGVGSALAAVWSQGGGSRVLGSSG